MDFKIKNVIIVVFLVVFGIALLPNSPFVSFIDAIDTIPYVKWLNWFLPVGEIIVVMEVWLTAILGYYVVSMILRWIHVIH